MINLRLCIKPLQKRFAPLFIRGMNREERQKLRSVILEDNKLQAEFLALKEAKECLNKGASESFCICG